MVMRKNNIKKSQEDTYCKHSSGDLKRIGERAYYIWLNKGKPASSATGDWLQAEKELKKEGLI